MLPFSPIQISPAAVRAISAVRSAKQIPAAYALRLGIRGAGCSGDFLIGFDYPQADSDEVYVIEGLEVCIRKAHLLYLAGALLDCQKTPEGDEHLVILHPTAPQ